jgi:PRTRC genetic system protein B
MSMVHILSGGDDTLHLKTAVLLYESNRGSVYATTHAIDIDGVEPNRPVIGPGTPLSCAVLSQFAKAVDIATAYAGFVPDNLLYTAPSMMAWWAPAMQRRAWFKSHEKSVGNRDGVVHHPALVFVAQADALFVFALRMSSRPALSTKLYHSPHFNVYSDGRICTGNVKLPGAPSSEAIAEYEDAFYRSHFTHSHHPGAVKYKGGMTKLWIDQLEIPDEASMSAALKPTKFTLKQAIELIASSSRNAR